MQGTPKHTGDLRAHRGTQKHTGDPKAWGSSQQLPKTSACPSPAPSGDMSQLSPSPATQQHPHTAGVTPEEATPWVTAPAQLHRWPGTELPPPCPFVPRGCSARSRVLQEGGFQGWPHGSFLATLFQRPGSNPPHRLTPAPGPHGHGSAPPGHTQVLQDARRLRPGTGALAVGVPHGRMLHVGTPQPHRAPAVYPSSGNLGLQEWRPPKPNGC